MRYNPKNNPAGEKENQVIPVIVLENVVVVVVV
jgi:hypothetical protein